MVREKYRSVHEGTACRTCGAPLEVIEDGLPIFKAGAPGQPVPERLADGSIPLRSIYECTGQAKHGWADAPRPGEDDTIQIDLYSW